MQSLAEMAVALNRSPVYLSGLQKRFELPPLYGYFNPPWIPSFFRHNEVMIRVQPQ